MKATTAEAALAKVKSHAESIKNDGPHEIEVMDEGDMWCQGDVGLLKIGDVPPDARHCALPSRLAPGTTRGARHLLEWAPKARAYLLPDATPLDGPVIDAPGGMRVGHPEHGDVTLPPGAYAVVYQRAYADELRRTQD